MSQVTSPSTPPVDALLPVKLFLPNAKDQWRNDACARGLIPGAVKIGRKWLIRQSDIDALVNAKAPRARGEHTAEKAAANLRAWGILQ